MTHGYPNVERALIAWLTDRTGRPVYTETPNTLTAQLPAYQVERIGGNAGTDTSRVFTVQVDALATDRPTLWDAVQTAEDAMDALAGSGTDGPSGWLVDDAVQTFGFAIAEHPNSAIRRATSVYALTMRRGAH